jgi:hypothetical protein
VLELNSEQYIIQLEASAARVRSSQLEEAAERARTAESVFTTALADVYRDPVEAGSRSFTRSATCGIANAVETLKDRPQELGPLVAVEQSRAFGLGSTRGDAYARKAAVRCSIRGRDCFEATERVHEIAANDQERRLATASRRSLHALFLDPAKARTTLSQFAIDRGVAETLEALRLRPQEIAELRRPNLDPATITELGARAALAWKETLDRSGANVSHIPGPGAIESEITAARTELERAQSRGVAIRRELASLPDRCELERRILRLLDRISPNEVQQLRQALSAPQLALISKLKSVIRDTALGRDEMQHS